MNNKKTIILTIIAIFILATISVSLTYAFFRAQGGTTVTKNVNITTHTVDTLTFSVSDNIAIEATQQNFTELDSNLSDEATTTAILTPNSKTGSASKNYYVYLNIPTNGTVYSSANTNSDPELLLQVFDGSNQLVTLTGLGTQKTVDSLTGYDITGKVGLYTLLDNHQISASNNTATTENYRVVITLINHDFDQYENTGKQVTGSLIVRETPTTFCDVNPTNEGCNFTLTYNPSVNPTVLANGYIYHHDSTLENGANDGSFRYAGENPNNYVCFGSDAVTCPDDNIYRIIGKIPVDVVTDETDPQNPVIENQSLYKLIRHNYENEASLGMTKSSNAMKCGDTQYCSYSGPNGNQPSGSIDGFKWKGTLVNNYNTWSLSTLNTTGLNTNAYGTFSSTWQGKIAKVIWKVGGNTSSNISNVNPMNIVYTNEIVNPVTTNSQDAALELANKIGLLYVSDYGYAVPHSIWNTRLISYSFYSANDWLYRGVREWTITRDANNTNYVFEISESGSVTNSLVTGTNYAARRAFYLTEDTTIDMSTHAGTLADPYRIS